MYKALSPWGFMGWMETMASQDVPPMGSQEGGKMGTPWVGSPGFWGFRGPQGFMGPQGAHSGTQGIPGGFMRPQGLRPILKKNLADLETAARL